MALKYWIGSTGSQSWGNTANWSSGSLPATGDDVVIANSSSVIDSGLSQSGVTLASLVIDSTFAGTIGTTSTPLSISATLWRVNEEGIIAGQAGSGRIYINFGSVQFTGVVGATPAALEDGLQAVRILGSHASNALSVTGASTVGVATNTPAETATIATLRVGAGSAVELGKGVTWTTISNTGGNVDTYSGGTTLTTFDGVTTTRGTGVITTVSATGGVTALNHRASSGDSVTTLKLLGGTVDLTADGRAIQAGTTNLRNGSVLQLYSGQLTSTAVVFDLDTATQLSVSAA